MFSLLKQGVVEGAQVAVCPTARGIAVARVLREIDLPPVLEHCQFVTATAEKQPASFAQLRKSLDLEGYECASVMAPGSYNLLLVETPDVQPAELRAAVRWRVKDLIDFHVDDAVIDVFEVPNQKAAGRNTMMYAVVARASIVKQRVDMLTEAGINLTVVDIPELALRNLAALLPEDVGGVASVYLDAHTGLITITRQGVLYLSRQIELGYEDMAGAGENNDLLQGQADRIVIEIQRSLDYYESHFSQPNVANVIIMPNPGPVTDLGTYLNNQLDLQVRELDINQLLDQTSALDRSTQAHCLLAVGTALRQEGKSL